jgi:hypothetical protein
VAVIYYAGHGIELDGNGIGGERLSVVKRAILL